MKRRLANPDLVRLWTIGGANNMVRWLEILAAALFTLEATGSGFAVAAVTAARTLPLLLFGALAGVLSESVSRKRIQLVGVFITLSTSLAIAGLAWAGLARPWHIAVAGFVAGSVWSTDMSTRRRMVGDAAPSGMVSRAIAMDSLAGALTRMAGPLAGSAAFGAIGLRGAYTCSAAMTLLTLLLVLGVHHEQTTRTLHLSRVPRDLAEGFAAARGLPAIRAVLGVTVAMNLFSFAYTALVAPIGLLVFAVPVGWVGALAAAEPLGSIIGGLALASYTPAMSARRLLLGGSALFTVMLGLMPLAPGFALACLMLVLGGIGLAGFSNVQTTLILANAPPALRSRLMGLTTVCMGTGPLGLLLIGALADRVGPMVAVQAVAVAGLAGLAVVTLDWISSVPPGRPTVVPAVPLPATAASTAQSKVLPPPDR